MDVLDRVMDAAKDDPLMDVEELERQAEEARQLRDARLAERLERFAQSLSRTRDKAKSWREQTGIEQEWDRADDAYAGVDDANRGHVSLARKPATPDGGVISTPASHAQRSTVLLNITRPYVDAAAARVGDMLLPVDDKPWALEPTPVPAGRFAPNQVAQAAAQSINQPPPGVANAGVLPPGGGMMSPESMQPELNSGVRTAAEGASKWIEDKLVECRWHAEMRKVFDDAARLGTGCIKGPVPAYRKSRRVTRDGGGVVIDEEVSLVPESRHVDIRNVYPDPSCGDDIQNGSYVWERDLISAKQLRELIGLPGYLESQIEYVLEMGPGSAKKKVKTDCTEDSRFEVWYYHGSAEREDLEAAGVDLEGAPEMVSAPCLLALVEDVVIQAALAPLDSGSLPYDFMPWQKKDGLPWGTGVAMQMETPQRGLTAALRNLMDNAGVSAGAQVVVNRSSITPADGAWSVGGGVKFWWLNEGADVNEVRKAFDVYTIPSMQQELQAIIQLYMKAAEDTTGMPQFLQGQLGTQAPDTFGGQVMLMNNAGAFLRRIARQSDDMVTERHIERYYEWLLIYGDDDEIKGDFQVNARGSTAMVELALQNQFIYQMGQMAMNPAFGVDPEKWFVEMLKSQRLDPDRFTMDEQKKAQLSQQQQPPPQIAVAQINAESRQRVAEMQTQAAVKKMRLDTDRDAVYTETQRQRDISNAQAKLAELEIKRELAMLEYANREKVTLDSIKADLAKKAMEIQSVERLAGLQAKADQLPTPPIEPQGKAPPGESWQK